MSCYIGFELAIRSDQKETVLCALKDLCRLNSNVRNEGTLVQVKDSFILSQNSFGEISTYKEMNEDIEKVARKYGCEIEIISESSDACYSEHYYHDGRNSIDEGGRQYIISSYISNMEDLKKTSPFTSILSKEAAEAFIAKPDLLKKWCGFHNLSLLYSEPDYYIGKGYDNTERLIHLDQYNKLNGDYNIKEMKYLDNVKTLLTFDFDDHETIYEFDDDGRLTHKKNATGVNNSEIWYEYNAKGMLAEIRKSNGMSMHFHYDNEGNLIHKEKYILGKKFDVWYEHNAEGKITEKRETYKNRTLESINYSYDENGLLIHYKDDRKETWWNSKGELIHETWNVERRLKYLDVLSLIDSVDNPEALPVKEEDKSSDNCSIKKGEVYYEYSDDGKLIKEHYPNGYDIVYDYNEKGQMFKEMDSDGHLALHFFDSYGDECRKICFNPNNQIVYDTDYKDREIWYGYDENGKQFYRIDKNGNETIF